MIELTILSIKQQNDIFYEFNIHLNFYNIDNTIGQFKKSQDFLLVIDRNYHFIQ